MNSHQPFISTRCENRNKISITVALVLFVSVMVPIYSAQAKDYTLVSLVSVETDFSQFLRPHVPSINNLGEVAYARIVRDPVDGRNEARIFVDDGTGPVELVNLTEAGFSAATLVVINDNGAVGATATSLSGGRAVLIRVESNGSITPIADAQFGGMADFKEIEVSISMNNAGQIAAKVTRNDNIPAIVLVDDSGITEIAAQSLDLTNLSLPTVNSSLLSPRISIYLYLKGFNDNCSISPPSSPRPEGKRGVTGRRRSEQQPLQDLRR